MLSRDWIKNLALSQYDGQQWHIPHHTSYSLANRALDQLTDMTQDAVSTYNSHSKTPISMFPLNEVNGQKTSGILLLRGKIQIRLAGSTQDGAFKMIGTAILAEGYMLKEKLFTSLIPHEDPWGAIHWRHSNDSSWTTEQLIRNVFIHLLEHATRL